MTATATISKTLEQLATELLEATAQLKAWEDVRKATLAELEALHAVGGAPEKFRHAGISYTRIAGRTTFDYSDAPLVVTAQDRLKAAQEDAKALGLAIPKTGAASWRVSGSAD